jgi:hypothetical protein
MTEPISFLDHPFALQRINSETNGTFKKELEGLVETSVQEPAGRSAWVAPTFILPKRDGTVR